MLRVPLPLRHAALVDGQVAEVSTPHDLWLLADQDCDLAWQTVVGEQSDGRLVELRPVFVKDPPEDWGIRSQRFLIDDTGHHLRGASAIIRVTPAVVAAGEHIGCLVADHQLRLKTWLGLRYNRPAVPQRYVGLARALAEQLSKRKARPAAARYRDVLGQFRRAGVQTMYSLVAVLPGGGYAADAEEVVAARTWLADAARAVPAELGTAASLDAYGDEDVSLGFVENSYSLDLSRLSWPPNNPGPVGNV